MKNPPLKQKKHTIETFFGKPYIVIFAIILFGSAAAKLAFTLSRNSISGMWKFVLIFDTLSALLVSSSLFLFYMSSDTKSKTGTKISGITFIVASAMSVFTQITVFIYMATLSNLFISILTFLFFCVPSIFMLRFAICLSNDISKRVYRAKGTLEFAAAKAFSIVAALIINFVDTEPLKHHLTKATLINLDLFRNPFIKSSAINTFYPDLAFYCMIFSCLALAGFALLYHKFATAAPKENNDTKSSVE